MASFQVVFLVMLPYGGPLGKQLSSSGDQGKCLLITKVEGFGCLPSPRTTEKPNRIHQQSPNSFTPFLLIQSVSSCNPCEETRGMWCSPLLGSQLMCIRNSLVFGVVGLAIHYSPRGRSRHGEVLYVQRGEFLLHSARKFAVLPQPSLPADSKPQRQSELRTHRCFFCMCTVQGM